VSLRPGELGEQRYPWKNQGDTVPRQKVVRIAYFQPWDWIIGAGSYVEEFYQAKDRVNTIGAQQQHDSDHRSGRRYCVGVDHLVSRGPRHCGQGASRRGAALGRRPSR